MRCREPGSFSWLDATLAQALAVGSTSGGRVGSTSADYTTSEYQASLENEDTEIWENDRGVGLSFGYNQAEDLSHALVGPEAVRHLIDVVTRGGRLLFGVGPMADGRLPEWQSQVVASLEVWMDGAGKLLRDVGPSERGLDLGRDVWVRLGAAGEDTYAFIDADAPVMIDGDLLTPGWATLVDGTLRLASDRPGAVVVRLPN